MSKENPSNVIQYVPFMSFVHPSFWHSLTEVKLNVDKLNETSKQIFGRFSYRDDISTIFEVDGTSFNRIPQDESFYANITGTIMNKNTIEEFKNIDKPSLLNSIGEMICANIQSKTWIDNPNALLQFFILSFADLKKFHYYYWFAFPSPSQPTVYVKESESATNHFKDDELQSLFTQHKALEQKQKPFFIIQKDTIKILTLAMFINENKTISDNTYFGFLDPNNSENPGWPLRLYIAAILDHYPNLASRDIKVFAMRYNLNVVCNSKVFVINVPENVQPINSSGWVGWERNDKGNFGPRLANMSASMDPVKLADASSDLNIRLMKWRLVPDLDINAMKEAKCLLLGAGTLGCHVARNLLAWGFRHVTFVDNGKVSYSNPTRQVLFTYQDCAGGGRKKAEAAADNLKKILPTINSTGLSLHIPMPGHPVGETLKNETIANIEKLTQAISDHDVIFLLLDTREARWMPTLIAAHYKKIVINAALGFDSYLVMRHGISDVSSDVTMTSELVPGGHLGCYFCNDVTAPGNSTRDRTLDQQCTVTRAGVAAVAGALAVELLVGLLAHPDRVNAPAVYNLTDAIEKGLPSEAQGVLGPIPHSIRGFLHSYQNVVPTCVKFKQCIACSDVVVDKYRKEGIEFLLKVCESGKYLEQVTGLEQLHLTAEMTDILTFSDEEED